MHLTASLTELLHELDGTTYFFVSGGLFLGITAMVFLILGMWLGRMIWRRHKGHRLSAETSVEFLKNENAQLKVRIADLSTRLSALGAAGLTRSEALPPPIPGETGGAPQAFTPAGTPLPPARGFTLWTLPQEETPPTLSLPPSRAFTLWTETQPLRPARISDFLPVVSHTFTTGSGWQPPTSHPRSQAFTVWTESPIQGEVSAPAPSSPLPPSRAFTLWTAAEDAPTTTTPTQPTPRSRAFTLWTVEAPAPDAPAAVMRSTTDRVAAAAQAVRAIAMPPPPASTMQKQSPIQAPSRAFTVWTSGDGPHVTSGITQRTALAALIRSRVEEPDPAPLPSSPALAPATPTPTPKAPVVSPSRPTHVSTAPAAPAKSPAFRPQQQPPPPPAPAPSANPVPIEPLPFVHLDE